MRNVSLTILVILLGLLAVNPTHAGGPFRSLRVFGTGIPVEAAVIGLVLAVLVLLPRRERRDRRESSPPPPPPANDAQTLREVNYMIQRMEERIESLETILLERETRTSTRRSGANV